MANSLELGSILGLCNPGVCWVDTVADAMPGLKREVAMFREHRHFRQFDQETLEFSEHLRRLAAVVMVVAARVIMVVRAGRRTAIRRA